MDEEIPRARGIGLLDQRGRREEYIDQDRYVQKLIREKEMLKSV
jgi:hypothetical protein